MNKDPSPLELERKWPLLGAVFLVSFALISLEITLPRLLSVIVSYHYVFAVLSLALLGLGAGGVFVHRFWRRIVKDDDPVESLILSASLFSLLIPVTAVSILHLGYLSRVQDHFALYGIPLFFPFFFAGIFFAVLYKMYPSISGRTYGVDLLGAAAGALGAILALDGFGGLGVHFFIGVLASSAPLLLAMRGTKRRRGKLAAFVSLGLSAGLLAANLAGLYQPRVPVGRNPEKEIHQALSESTFKGEIVRTKWSSFGRTDLVKYGLEPGHMDLYIDGTAGSPMYRFNGNPVHPNPAVEGLKHTFPGYFPFLHLRENEREKALIIGPGGGRDVLLALMGGVQKITAVEVNGDLVEIVRRYSNYNGGIYNDSSRVRVVVDEGRHFLKRQKEKYDIIMLNLPVTNTSRSLEGFALTENFLLTKDSILDYLGHLTDEGSLMVVGHNDAEVLRLLSMALSVLDKKGTRTQDAMNQIYITGSQGAENYLVFVLRKKPFELQESISRYETMLRMGFDAVSSYFPHIGEKGGLNPGLAALSKGRMSLDQLEKMIEQKGYDISPVTDDTPFFYKIERGIPRSVSLIFVSSLVCLCVVIGVPLLYRVQERTKTERPGKRKGGALGPPVRPVILFALLGMAFMMIELSLIQRFILFLGQPVISMVVLLFSLLAGAGLGSLRSSRIDRGEINAWIAKTSLCVGVLVVGYTFLLPAFFDQILGLDLLILLGATVFLVAPLGFLMGFPFPLGIRLLKQEEREREIPWMWGINGVCSVLGSSATIVVALTLGFSSALLIGAACYFVIFLIFRRSS